MKTQKHIYIGGIHAVNAIVERSPELISKIYFNENRSDARLNECLEKAKHAHVSLVRVNSDKLNEILPDIRHQGIVAELSEQPSFHESDLEGLLKSDPNPLILVLDGIQDPHNLGACLRASNCAGATCVIIPKDKSVQMTSSVYKVAAGAAFVTPLLPVTNLARTLKQLKDAGVWIYGLAGEASDSFYDIDLKGPVALVLGAEQKGLRRLTRDNCDSLCHIPMKGTVNSLNVSVTAGVVLFEALRQRA